MVHAACRAQCRARGDGRDHLPLSHRAGVCQAQSARTHARVCFADVVYVLHVFQKKSKRGIATPKKELDLIDKRLKLAEQVHKQKSATGGQP
ncbi:MAG: type II toxin-antitoxin system RelE/ParE family toxin [Hyphomicrobium sp.]